MRILFDENAPNKLVEGIKALTFFFELDPSIEITSVQLLGKLSAIDEDVLEIVGNGGVLISYDKDFKKHKKLKKIIFDMGIAVFWVQQPKQPRYFQLAKFLINNWEEIIDKAINERKPFIYQINKSGTSKIII
jgi:hypothetical protein